MARLEWEILQPEESGLENGVLYLDDRSGVPWNGLTRVVDESTPQIDLGLYFDGLRYVIPQGSEDFKAILEALVYPEEFEDYAGGGGLSFGYSKRLFGLSYRTGRWIHIVYNATATPTTVKRATTTSVIDPLLFAWDISTTPVSIPGGRPSAHLIIDTDKAYLGAIEALEAMIYGDENNDPYLPTVDELIELFDEYSIFVVIDHGDGTWTAIGPDEMIRYLNETTFEITSESAVYIDSDTYTLSSI